MTETIQTLIRMTFWIIESRLALSIMAVSILILGKRKISIMMLITAYWC
jgi:hypothetical protein